MLKQHTDAIHKKEPKQKNILHCLLQPILSFCNLKFPLPHPERFDWLLKALIKLYD